MVILYVVISIWHSKSRDFTFLHGVFEEMSEAQKVVNDVNSDLSYVEKEGYELSDGEGLSTYISEIPYCQRVNDFIPMNY
jgi:hypothetical protein